MRILSVPEALETLKTRKPYQSSYLGMYSSLLGGVVLEPSLMMIPIDDHMVHRGDGVFEAIKCKDGRVYGLMAHLERLAVSAAKLELSLPHPVSQIATLVCETIRAIQIRDCLVRLYVSRGPGGFTTNPYESAGSQLYIVITELKEPRPELYEKGGTLATSKIEVKPDFFATIKSCNYLPNVLMKKEAVDLKVDFTVAVDSEGFVAEGSTENVGFILPGNRFVVPSFKRTLRGITATRISHLAQSLVASGELQSADTAQVSLKEAFAAEEVFMLGTTLDVLPIIRWDQQSFSGPGKWTKRLLQMLRDDMKTTEFATAL